MCSGHQMDNDHSPRINSSGPIAVILIWQTACSALCNASSCVEALRPPRWKNSEVCKESSEMKPAIMSKRIHRGTDLRDFLSEEDLLEGAESRALRRGVALRLDRLRKEQHVSKSRLALRMNTSRAVVNRLLDPSNPSMTLAALGKAARVLRRRLLIELVPG